MRILFLSNVYPNPVQPLKGTFNRSMVAALARQHQLQVISPVSWIDALRARLQSGARLTQPHEEFVKGVHADYPLFYYPPKVLRHRFGDFLWKSIQHSVTQTLKKFQPEAVLSYWAHPDGDVALRIARMCCVPAISMVGGSDVLLLARSGKRRTAIMNVLQQSDAVISVSQHISDSLKLDGISPEKLHVVYRGLDRQLFSPGDKQEARQQLKLPGKQTLFVAVGRLVDVKGHEQLLAACRVLSQQGHNFQCHILGDGPLRKQLQQQINGFDLQNCVHLSGSQSQAELVSWYRAADCVVHPSYSEGIPNVLFEAMSCGTRFVASNVGGIPEIADADYDLLVPPRDCNALAQAMASHMQQLHSDNGTRVFMPTSWEESARLITKVIEQASAHLRPAVSQKTLAALQPMLENASAERGQA